VCARGGGEDATLQGAGAGGGRARAGPARRPGVWGARPDRRLRGRVRAFGAVPFSPRLVRH